MRANRWDAGGPRDDRRSHTSRERNVHGDEYRPEEKRARFDAPEEGELPTREPSPGAEVEYEMQTEEDEARIVEERRKRRLAILQKHKEEAPQRNTTPAPSSIATPKSTTTPPAVVQQAGSVSPAELHPNGTEEFELGKEKQEASAQQAQATEMSAAAYDPSVDRALDKEREVRLLGEGTSDRKTEQAPAGHHGDNDSEYEEVEVDDDEDIDDMFAIDESDEPKKKKMIRVKKNRGDPAAKQDASVAGIAAGTAPAPESAAAGAPATLLDNWDDPDGYYRITLGERIGEGGRYQVFANLGRGMFSAVVKARDTQQDDREVAIKVIRSQESMYKAGIKEMSILRRLFALDPDDKRHLIRLLGHFEHRNHLCMVFESLSMNLREVIRRFGKDVGLNLRAVRAYAHQMFLALALMRKAEIMHADLKPDNILVNENKTVIKVCDLGSASDLSEMEITPYLVSRFYRAPEIILGLPYDCALDMWSIGCTLFELFTGRILFPGKSNNHMLLLMQELKGKFTTKQIRKGRFSGMHFDDQNAFVSRERDRATGTDVLRKVASFNPTSAGMDLRSRLMPPHAVKGMSQSDVRLTNSFIDLLNRTLELDPARRITPNQALQHSFFSG